jgi:hypothetical protein
VSGHDVLDSQDQARFEMLVLPHLDAVIELRDLSEAFDQMLGLFSIAASIGAQNISHTVNPSETESTLPFELRGIFLLAPAARNCFVSRILVGLAKDACARILGFTAKQVDAYTCAALHELSG